MALWILQKRSKKTKHFPDLLIDVLIMFMIVKCQWDFIMGKMSQFISRY